MRYFVFIVFVLISCSTKKYSKQLLSIVEGSDEITISYFKNNNIDSVEKVIRINDKQKINQFIAQLNVSSATINKKGNYSGQIHFFKKFTVIKDIFFSIEQSSSFDFKDEQGNWQGIKLNDKAAEFLNQSKNQELAK